MRSLCAAAIATIVVLGFAVDASAQRSGADRADRGQRLDSDAFRNDMLQDQLRQPAPPPMLQSAPPRSQPKKPKSTKRGQQKSSQ
jgi:hypothetical protein